jgi:transcriptional regulator with XRE-family HTH domain
MSIGKRLKIVRGKITQHDFAKLLSVHPNTVARYERDERSPDAEYLEKISKERGFNIQWITTGEGLMRKGELKKFSVSKIELINDILEDYKKELGEKFTSEKKTEIITKLYELLIDWDEP